MYLLFRYHHIKPSEFYKTSQREKLIMKAFIEKQLDDLRKENRDGR